MKIKAEVLSVDGTGDSIKVRVQGKERRAAEWRPYLAFTVEVPDTVKNRRAFYIGRAVNIMVEAV